MLQIFDSLSRRKQPLTPIQPGQVGLYVCGMTVYDLCHLGHARVLVVFDMVVRYLRECGYRVRYVRNITDIDDKIIRRANEAGLDALQLAAQYIDEMQRDIHLLGVLPPDEEPRATEHIPQIVQLIHRLLDNDLAYAADNGDLYFRVRRFPGYGALSGKSVDDLRVGARVAADEDKHDPLDFVLWKRAKPGEPSWPSPWGAGRPGWHIECSAMSICCLGNHFDIHAGGADLKFPHHENEIAQSEGATGERFANLWMHNGYVQVDDEKMAKSLGNFLTIREILERDVRPQRMGEIIRFMMLTSHYRSPLNYADGALDNARSGLTRLYLALSKLPPASAADASAHPAPSPHADRFHQYMQDDFNTPRAISVLFDVVREINQALDAGQSSRAAVLGDTLRKLAASLGLLHLPPAEFLDLQSTGDDQLTRQIEQLVAQRAAARSNKDWDEADRIRRRLDDLGVVLEDSGNTTSWRKT